MHSTDQVTAQRKLETLCRQHAPAVAELGAAQPGLETEVTESARAHSDSSSTQIRKTYKIWLLTCWLFTFGC